MDRPHVFEGRVPDDPLKFVSKQLIAVSIPNAYFGGNGVYALPHTYCEVYAPIGLTTNVCSVIPLMRCHMSDELQVHENFSPFADETVEVAGDVVDLTVPDIHNYHHFIVDFLVRFYSDALPSFIIIITNCAFRLVVSHKTFVAEGRLPNVRPLLPSKVIRPFSGSMQCDHVAYRASTRMSGRR